MGLLPQRQVRIFSNGRIFTSATDDNELHEAMAVHGRSVSAIGKSAEVESQLSQVRTRVYMMTLTMIDRLGMGDHRFEGQTRSAGLHRCPHSSRHAGLLYHSYRLPRQEYRANPRQPPCGAECSARYTDASGPIIPVRRTRLQTRSFLPGRGLVDDPNLHRFRRSAYMLAQQRRVGSTGYRLSFEGTQWR